MASSTLPAASSASDAMRESGGHAGGRLAVLDGWRAVSILLVLCAHLLPLDIAVEGANNAAGAAGMAIFFTLSGFLITTFLFNRPEPLPFLIRRGARILPLAWVGIAIAWFMQPVPRDLGMLAANILFYANLPPTQLFDAGKHFWSLCLEVQFYAGVALLVALGGRRALYILPPLALTVTVLRVIDGEPASIVTWHRVDEILAGATLALAYAGALGARARNMVARLNFYIMAVFAVICCFALDTPFAFARPYAIAALVGSTLVAGPPALVTLLSSRMAAYVAATSYALYVFHGLFSHSWLGSGETIEKYLKRPLLFAATFGAAHMSTFWFERFFTSRANAWTKASSRRPTEVAL